MAVPIVVRGRFATPFSPIVGRISETTNEAEPAETVLVVKRGHSIPSEAATFAAVLIEDECSHLTGPRVGQFESLDHLDEGDIVLIDGRDGRVRTVFRRSSPHNALFLTERCNNNCLMCSQPPRDNDMLETCLRIVALLKRDAPTHLGITGGEPTLLGSAFVRLLESLRAELPETSVTVLSNARTFADAQFVRSILHVGHPTLKFSIPLHADVPDLHDYIAQSRGAFDETIAGFYNLESAGLESEVRVVLHALNAPRLPSLAEYIYRKLPFVRNVAFMGLEVMGYVKKNWNVLWINPIDYSGELRNAVEHLYRRGMTVSIYNLPLCLLPNELWSFSYRSISDHKQTFIETCRPCRAKDHCTGFFSSGTKAYAASIHPLVSPP
ncbi:His-Xaa-Ser system radical SAM maturase HxsC [Xanthobacteraceae bacterium Astr-EGSB]|uniref:His-Xaa-Ser system radical SAM maturase HxsC n=1 Tax=Astrobacterium formosum TaxID=3069710 RepID=UPI0027B3C2F3|nr:His-Xaa-Ser system radical SAM maturase HxsC [Xanthobacteraceae bacterium Astr-EGSB]